MAKKIKVLEENEYSYIIECDSCDKKLIYAKRVMPIGATEFEIRPPKRIRCIKCGFGKFDSAKVGA